MSDLMMKRRSFLKGVLSLAAVSATGLPAMAHIPTIYGDGIHCDVDGLSALFTGQPFRVENTGLVAENGLIRGGHFLLSRTLSVTRARDFSIDGARFQAGPEFDGRYLFEIKDCERLMVNNCYFECKQTSLDSVLRFDHD